ncbi:hypothetical protein H5410_001493 [Solanum commersonii]|uniref:Uncharacterized protein n=1 Tax=Solanum commersonii TaxID=4109 RepID=A0A9J6AZ73_SOLCO|nr:hypothetical protein H5410_001493 [Solanum commersonii]
MYTDNVTTHAKKTFYARVLIEVDVSQPRPIEEEIETPFGYLQQQIGYDWKPNFCNDCLKFEHDGLECWYNKDVKE